ncbi:MAG: HMA2 domain-containing protein [Microcystis aeruginosa]
MVLGGTSEFSANATPGISYQVVSSLPGRIRLRVPSLRQNLTGQNILQGAIAALESVTSVRVNLLANSIIVTFAEGKISPAQLEQELATAIGKAAASANPGAEVPQKAEFKAEKQVPRPSEEKLQVRENLADAKVGQTKTVISSQLGESKDDKISLNKITSHTLVYRQLEALPVNSWQRQCQEQAESIEKLEDQLAALQPVAAIGSAWLRRWYVHSPATIDCAVSTGAPLLVAFPKTPESEGQWQELAAGQRQVIAQLEQCLADVQRLAVIGEARLKKYRKYL